MDSQDTILQALHGQRVLVTGASGFTGSHLVRALVDGGAHVRVLVRQPSALVDLGSRIERAIGDIRDSKAVNAAVEDSAIVFHVAALYRDAGVESQAYFDVNVTGTDNVLAACEAHQVKRLVHCSTTGVHGGVTQIPSDETAPFHPGDPYQKSKLIGEEHVWEWYRRTQIPTTVVRPLGIYGPGDLRFLKLFRGIQKGYFVTLGSGKTWFQMVYIDDLVQAFLRCAVKAEAAGEVFCIASDKPVQLNELVAGVAETLGVSTPRWHLPVWPFYAAGALCEAICVPFKISPPLHRRRVGFFTHHRAFTMAKAERLIGYRSEVSLKEGLRRTAAWYQTQGYLKKAAGGQLTSAV